MNDNDPTGVAEVLTTFSDIGMLIDPGFNVLLESLGASHDLRLAVKDYVGDVMKAMNKAERQMLGYVRRPNVAMLFNSVVQPLPLNQLENYAMEFEALAATGSPQLVRLAASFKALVDGMARGKATRDGPER